MEQKIDVLAGKATAAAASVQGRPRARKQKLPRKHLEGDISSDCGMPPRMLRGSAAFADISARMTTRSRTGSLQPSKFSVSELMSPGRKARGAEEVVRPPSAVVLSAGDSGEQPTASAAKKRRRRDEGRLPGTERAEKRRRISPDGSGEEGRRAFSPGFDELAAASSSASRYFDAQRPYLGSPPQPPPLSQPPVVFSTPRGRRPASNRLKERTIKDWAAARNISQMPRAAATNFAEWPDLPPILAALSLVPTKALLERNRSACSEPPTANALVVGEEEGGAVAADPLPTSIALESARNGSLSSVQSMPYLTPASCRPVRENGVLPKVSPSPSVSRSGSLVQELLASAPSTTGGTSKRVHDQVAAVISQQASVVMESGCRDPGRRQTAKPSVAAPTTLPKGGGVPQLKYIFINAGPRKVPVPINAASNGVGSIAKEAPTGSDVAGLTGSCRAISPDLVPSSGKFAGAAGQPKTWLPGSSREAAFVRAAGPVPSASPELPPGQSRPGTFVIPRVPAVTLRRRLPAEAVPQAVGRQSVGILRECRSPARAVPATSGRILPEHNVHKEFEVGKWLNSNREAVTDVLLSVARDLQIEPIATILLEGFTDEKDEYIAWKWMGVALLLVLQKCITVATDHYVLPVPSGLLKTWNDLNHFFVLYTNCLRMCQKYGSPDRCMTSAELYINDSLFDTILRNVFISYSEVSNVNIPMPDELQKLSDFVKEISLPHERSHLRTESHSVRSRQQLAADFHDYASRILEETSNQLARPPPVVLGEPIFPGLFDYTLPITANQNEACRALSLPPSNATDDQFNPEAAASMLTESHQVASPSEQPVLLRKARMKVTPTRAQLLSMEINPDSYYSDKHRQLRRKVAPAAGMCSQYPTDRKPAPGNEAHGQAICAAGVKRKNQGPVPSTFPPKVAKHCPSLLQPPTVTRSGRLVAKPTK